MSQDEAYGKPTKRIVFTTTEHQHAKLLIRLKQDGLRQSDFFRCLIEGYISDDGRLQEFIAQNSGVSQKHKLKSSKLSRKGKKTMIDLGLDEGEVADLFDVIAQEHPDL